MFALFRFTNAQTAERPNKGALDRSLQASINLISGATLGCLRTSQVQAYYGAGARFAQP